MWASLACSCCVQAALNLGASVARMGVYGEAGERLWVVSHTEGLHLWEWQAACDEEAPGSCWVLLPEGCAGRL